MTSAIPKKNEWFRDASAPAADLAAILIALDARGAIPNDMRIAIKRHAENTLETLPRSMRALSQSLAAAASDGMIDGNDAAQAAYGLAGMADTLESMYSLEGQFSEPRRELAVAA